MIFEAMLVGLSYVGNSNTTFPGKVTFSDRPRVVATAVERPILSQTQDTSDLWSMQALGENYFKLISFAQLKRGWDGYSGEEIPAKAIAKVIRLLLDLKFQPNIFPTGRGSIQVEYYRDDETFAEIEVSKNSIDVYFEGIGGTIEEEGISEKRACELLEAAYGRED